MNWEVYHLSFHELTLQDTPGTKKCLNLEDISPVTRSVADLRLLELNFDKEHYVFLKQYSAKIPKDVIEEMLKTDCRYGRISKLYAFDKAGEQHEIEEIEMLKKLLRAFPVDTMLFWDPKEMRTLH